MMKRTSKIAACKVSIELNQTLNGKNSHFSFVEIPYSENSFDLASLTTILYLKLILCDTLLWREAVGQAN